jgi:hypothetical protein
VKEVLIRWFFRLWLAGFTVSAIVWLWKNFPVGLVLLAILTILVAREFLSKRWRRQKLGYWVEYISPGILRAGDDDFAVVYHEEERQHYFYGKVGQPPAPDILTVPSEATWQSQVPVWMSGKRATILNRIRQEFSRVQVVETDSK